MPEPLDLLHIEYATDKVLADIESFTEFLAGNCRDATAVSSEYECRKPPRLTAASLPTLLHAAITAAMEGNAMMSGKALEMIAERYLTDNRNRIAHIASESAMEDKL